MRENRENKLKANMEHICLVSKYNSKTENSRLHNPRLVSSVNKPTSVGIDPVSSLESSKIIREKIREIEVNC